MIRLDLDQKQIDALTKRGRFTPLPFTDCQRMTTANYRFCGKKVLVAHLVRGMRWSSLDDEFILCEQPEDVETLRQELKVDRHHERKVSLITWRSGELIELPCFQGFVYREEVDRYLLDLLNQVFPALQFTLLTSCTKLFQFDSEFIAEVIGKPLEEKFGLESFDFSEGIKYHYYSFCDHHIQSDFYEKYPDERVDSAKFVIGNFAEMIHDLIKIRFGLRFVAS